jgi:hypothetical protein
MRWNSEVLVIFSSSKLIGHLWNRKVSDKCETHNQGKSPLSCYFSQALINHLGYGDHHPVEIWIAHEQHKCGCIYIHLIEFS